MKKLLLALTLVICLMASLVALTSCGGGGDDCEHTWATTPTVDTAATCTTDGSESIKCTSCGEKKADSVTAIPAVGHAYDEGVTTAATCTDDGSATKTCATCGDVKTEVIPATGEHVWRANAVIDVYPTCTTEGSKSIKCIYCQGTKPDSTEVIPASGHTEAPVVIQPTLFSEGLAEGECTACGEEVSQILPKTEAKVEILNAGNNSEIRDFVYFYDLIGDDHFYPTEENPNGKSLYVEFSFLWNETLAKVTTNEAYAQFGRINGANDAGACAPWWFAFGDNCDALWCQLAGGFEVGHGVAPLYGPTIDGNTAEEDFPNIGDYGWHRIGMKYTQLTEVDNAPDNSNMLCELYIDGSLVISYYMAADERCLLYTGDAESGYADNLDIKLLFYRIAKPKTTEGEAYFVIADAFYSVGGGFVLDVEPLATPTEGTYSPTEGVELPANLHFAVSTDE